MGDRLLRSLGFAATAAAMTDVELIASWQAAGIAERQNPSGMLAAVADEMQSRDILDGDETLSQ